MICHEVINIEGIDLKNHFNPARAENGLPNPNDYVYQYCLARPENDLPDPNDYDYQYCLLGPRMICPIPMIMIISIACSGRE